MLDNKITQLNAILIDAKAGEITTINIPDTGYEILAMIIVTSTSVVHAKGIANYLKTQAKKQKLDYLATEGERNGNWILLDLNDVMVHIMTQEMRSLYQLESLWSNTISKPIA